MKTRKKGDRLLRDSALCPEESYREPGYPQKEHFIQYPELLLRFAPPAWLKKKAAAGALLTFIMAGFSHIRAGENPAKTGAFDQVTLNERGEEKTGLQKRFAAVAPLFVHGEGLGAVGCVVISPPVFLSEHEALEIIFKELQKEGLTVDKRDLVIGGLDYGEDGYRLDEVPFDGRDGSENILPPFYFDGFVSGKNLGIKFISRWNCSKLGGSEGRGTVEDFYMIEAAQEAKELLRAYGKANAVVFYDPLEDTKESSRELLKNQVRDFLEWMKSEISAGLGREKR